MHGVLATGPVSATDTEAVAVPTRSEQRTAVWVPATDPLHLHRVCEAPAWLRRMRLSDCGRPGSGLLAARAAAQPPGCPLGFPASKGRCSRAARKMPSSVSAARPQPALHGAIALSGSRTHVSVAETSLPIRHPPSQVSAQSERHALFPGKCPSINHMQGRHWQPKTYPHRPGPDSSQEPLLPSLLGDLPPTTHLAAACPLTPPRASLPTPACPLTPCRVSLCLHSMYPLA